MKKRGMELTGNEVKPRWELDYDLLENEGLFGEYLEMGMSPGINEDKLLRQISSLCARRVNFGESESLFDNSAVVSCSH